MFAGYARQLNADKQKRMTTGVIFEGEADVKHELHQDHENLLPQAVYLQCTFQTHKTLHRLISISISRINDHNDHLYAVQYDEMIYVTICCTNLRSSCSHPKTFVINSSKQRPTEGEANNNKSQEQHARPNHRQAAEPIKVWFLKPKQDPSSIGETSALQSAGPQRVSWARRTQVGKWQQQTSDGDAMGQDLERGET